MKNTFFSILTVAASCVTALGQASTAPFTVTITANQEPCKAGDPCLIHIVLKDTSPGTLTLPEERSGGELNYRVSVWLSSGSPATDTDYGRKLKDPYPGGSRSVLIKYMNEGDEIADDLDINRVVDLSNPGFYTVQVERGDRLYSDLHVKSNKLTVQVAP